ncbi:MAG: M28 family metallopeptidase [Arenimonas sp.]
MTRLALAVLGTLASTAAFAHDAPKGIDPRQLAQMVQVLSSDEFEGRGPATPGEDKTIGYLVARMQAAGLQPGGDLHDGARGWTQAVPLGRFRHTGPLAASIAQSGATHEFSQGEDIAVRAAMNGARRVDIDNAPVVFVGYGVKAPEREWDDFKGMDLKGKVLVVLINDPDFETGQGAFGGKAMTYYGRWTYKFEEAARQGAAGMLIVHETAPASYGWQTVRNSNTITMFDIVRDKPADKHPPLEGWMQRDVAVAMFQRAGLDFEALKKQAQSADFRPVAIGDATFSAHYDVEAEVITSHNIVGRLDGTTHPEQNVIYTGHWDHLGVGAADATGDRINNGAVDNATGIAGLIEIGRLFAQQPRTARSVVVMAVTAEEKGLLGSEYYAANPLYPLGTTVGVINIDALSPYGPARDFGTSGSAKLSLIDDFVAAAAKAGLGYSADGHPEAGHFFRSDHFSFAKRGVPAFSFGSGRDWIDGGKAAGEAASLQYTEKRYHQPADEFDPAWSFTGMARDLGLLQRFGADLANSTTWPNWGVDSEFRAARDASSLERRAQ